MSDTNVQECKCCQIETDCIDGLCELCSAYNYKLQKQVDMLTLGILQEKNENKRLREALETAKKVIVPIYSIRPTKELGQALIAIQEALQGDSE